MELYITAIILYFILTFAALWIIDIKNERDSAEKKL